MSILELICGFNSTQINWLFSSYCLFSCSLCYMQLIKETLRKGLLSENWSSWRGLHPHSIPSQYTHSPPLQTTLYILQYKGDSFFLGLLTSFADCSLFFLDICDSSISLVIYCHPSFDLIRMALPCLPGYELIKTQHDVLI